MANYQEVKVELTNTQLNKLKSAARSKTGTILSVNKKNFEDLLLKNCLMNYL